MIDKEWLEKVSQAYSVYPYKNYKVSEFILWLYKQYNTIELKNKG